MLTMFSKIKKSNAISIIENILFANGIATYTNLKETIECTKPDFNDTFCVNFNILKDFVSKIPKSHEHDQVAFKVPDNLSDRVVVTCGSSRLLLAQEDQMDFPKTPSFDSKKELLFTKQHFADLVKISDYCSEDELRPAMTGICIDKKNFVTTDGHRLRVHKHKTRVPTPFILRPNKQLFKAIKSDVVAFYNNSNIVMDWGDYLYTARLIDERFPDYENVIPKDNPITIHLERSLFLRALEVAELASNKTTKQVVFTAEEGNEQAVVESEDFDFSTKAKETVPAMYLSKDRVTKVKDEEGNETEKVEKFPKLKIGFNGGFMIHAVKDNPKDSDSVTIKASYPNRAFLVDDDIIIMPVMLSSKWS